MFWGIDATRDGWVAVDLNSSSEPSIELLSSEHDLLDVVNQSELALCDIPMGLPDGEDIITRECDRLARRILKYRSCTVFGVPIRAAVYQDSWKHANEVQKRKTGKGISRQAWAIVPRMIEVDRLLREEPEIQKVFRESHPELCFARLNDDEPMRWSKHKYLGVRERLQIAAEYIPEAEKILARSLHRFNQVTADDMLDAFILAIHARSASKGEAVFLPKNPQFDALGLRMQMVAGSNC